MGFQKEKDSSGKGVACGDRRTSHQPPSQHGRLEDQVPNAFHFTPMFCSRELVSVATEVARPREKLST